MTQAENYEMLFDGGSKEQAEKLAESMSVWKTQDWENEATVYGFDDGSAIYASGTEYRVATPDEIAAFQ